MRLSQDKTKPRQDKTKANLDNTTQQNKDRHKTRQDIFSLLLSLNIMFSHWSFEQPIISSHWLTKQIRIHTDSMTKEGIAAFLASQATSSNVALVPLLIPVRCPKIPSPTCLFLCLVFVPVPVSVFVFVLRLSSLCLCL